MSSDPSERRVLTAIVTPEPTASVFAKEGEYWTIAFGGMLVRVRDVKGMACLAHLLAHPTERVPVAALLSEAVVEDSSREHVRVTVTKRIRAAVKKIEVHHPSLGHHLASCIKTGSYCTYMPDPTKPMRWVVSRCGFEEVGMVSASTIE